MAALYCNGKEIGIEDGAPLKEACRAIGVPFGCEHGVCGTCQIDIVSGAEHLFPLNDAEKDMGLDETHRLGCQCRIKEGTVAIRC